MKLTEHANFQDLSSVMALHNDYSSAEPFFEGIASKPPSNLFQVNMISESKR
jgi:hypothetical protein